MNLEQNRIEILRFLLKELFLRKLKTKSLEKNKKYVVTTKQGTKA